MSRVKPKQHAKLVKTNALTVKHIIINYSNHVESRTKLEISDSLQATL